LTLSYEFAKFILNPIFGLRYGKRINAQPKVTNRHFQKNRKQLGLKPGDQLAAFVEGDKIILRPKPKSPTARLRGLGKGTWGNKTKIAAYIEKLRDEWKRA